MKHIKWVKIYEFIITYTQKPQTQPGWSPLERAGKQIHYCEN